MKKTSKWDETKIKDQLMKMSKIKDKQSKEALFDRIQERLQKDEIKGGKKKHWLLPVGASVAALLLLALIIPLFLNEQDMASEINDDAHIMMDINEFPETDSEAEFNTKEALPDIETNDHLIAGYYFGAVQPRDEQELGTDLVTVAVDAYFSGGEIVVPVTVLSTGGSPLDRFMAVKDAFSGERWGLGRFPPISINSIREDKDRIAVIDVPKGSLENLSSAEMKVYSLALTETFALSGFNELRFTSDDETGVIWGQYGLLHEIDLQQPNRGYYIYVSDTGHQFLVNGRSVDAPLNNASWEEASLQEVLELMKQGDESKGYSPSIPEDVVITNVEMVGKTDDIAHWAKITFDETSFTEYREDYLIMIEAIMFAAKDFGIRFVQFEGIEHFYQIGPYQVNDLIEIPNYMNFIR